MTPQQEITRALMNYLPQLFLQWEHGYVSEGTQFHTLCERLSTDLLLAVRREALNLIEENVPHQHTWVYDDEPGRYRCDCGETFTEDWRR